MKEELITLETAILAKEKGFEETCLYYYDMEEEILFENLILESNFKVDVKNEYYELGQGSKTKKYRYANPSTALTSQNKNERLANNEEDGLEDELIWADAPTQSLLQKWLREKYNILLTVLPWKDHGADVNDKYTFRPMIVKIKTWEEFPTYEKALEKGLQEALKLI